MTTIILPFLTRFEQIDGPVGPVGFGQNYFTLVNGVPKDEGVPLRAVESSAEAAALTEMFFADNWPPRIVWRARPHWEGRNLRMRLHFDFGGSP